MTCMRSFDSIAHLSSVSAARRALACLAATGDARPRTAIRTRRSIYKAMHWHMHWRSRRRRSLRGRTNVLATIRCSFSPSKTRTGHGGDPRLVVRRRLQFADTGPRHCGRSTAQGGWRISILDRLADGPAGCPLQTGSPSLRVCVRPPKLS